MNRLPNKLNKLSIPTLAVLGAIGLSACSDTEPYGNIMPEVSALSICDGANIRNEPRVNDQSAPERGRVVGTVDYGDSPEGTCYTIPAEEVLVAQDFNNGNWYGIPNGDLNRGLGGQIVELKDDSQIVWINEQKAKPVEKS